jgi:uncharacterized Zn finger protein
VIFDFIGTLTYVKNYDLEASKIKLHRAMVESGLKVDSKDFLRAYSKALYKGMQTRHGRHNLCEIYGSKGQKRGFML